MARPREAHQDRRVRHPLVSPRSDDADAGKRQPLTKRAERGGGPYGNQQQATAARAASKHHRDKKKKGPLASSAATRSELRRQEPGDILPLLVDPHVRKAGGKHKPKQKNSRRRTGERVQAR